MSQRCEEKLPSFSDASLLHARSGYRSLFPIPAHIGAVVTKLLQGRIRPFTVKRNFNEVIGYVTDRKAGPIIDGNATYLGQYAGKTSYGLITVQVPQHHPAGSPIHASAIRKVESFPYPKFLKFLQDRSEKPLVIWIHGYRLSFPVSTTYCAEIARDLDIDGASGVGEQADDLRCV